jgi:hypothetical protein
LMWDTETTGADDGGEAAEGVGKFVGILEALLEELMLGVAREGRDEFKVESPHGGGGFDEVEVGVERAEEDIRREGWLGEDELTGVGGTVVKGESEEKLGGGALVVIQAVTEGLEEAFSHEKERFVAIDGRLEGVGDAVVSLGSVELKKTVVLAVGDIVELRELAAEAFGEPLTGELGEIGESLEPPEL